MLNTPSKETIQSLADAASRIQLRQRAPAKNLARADPAFRDCQDRQGDENTNNDAEAEIPNLRWPQPVKEYYQRRTEPRYYR